MPEPTSATGPVRGRRVSLGPVSSTDDIIRVMAELGPVRVTRMSVDPHSSTDDTIRVMAELSPDPPQETQWWWSEQIRRRVGGLVGSTGPSRFTLHLDVPRAELETTATALRAAVDEANAAFASRYEADLQARLQLARERQEQERRRFADAQAVLDRVMSK